MAPSPKLQGVPDQDHGSDNINTQYACNECRRRKARCPRELPVCSVCKKHGRHCLYQRHSRTPLTRKHLTEVEELLRISEEIISQHLPDIDISVELERSRNGESRYTVDPPRDVMVEEGTYRTGSSTKRQRQMSNEQSLARPSTETPLLNDVNSDLYTANVDGLGSPHRDDHGPDLLDSLLSLDNLPPNGQDYEWDERHGEAAAGLDGMASLSLQGEKPGYLGLASGAAMLNLIQKYTSDPFASIQPLPYSTTSLSQSKGVPNHGTDLKREIPNHKIAGYISDYFRTYHVSYPLVHEGIFMAQYSEIIPRPRTGWIVLMYMVAAIGSFMAATTPHDDDVVLFHLARSHLSVEMLEMGNLTLVQSLSLISNYLQKRDRPNSGYNYLGLAVRMAFGLGLHKEIPNRRSTLLQTEMRRRVWWCLYIFDAGSTITYSRPFGIPSTGIDAKLPCDTFDSDLNARSTVYPPMASSPTNYTNVRVQSQFHLLTSSLYNRVISKPCPSAKEVLAWDDLYIGKWLSLVPDYYKEDSTVPEQHALAHAIMIWRYKNLRMIIYRPFLLQKVLSSRGNLARDASQDGLTTDSLNDRTNGNNSSSGEATSSIYTDLACERCRKAANETISHIDHYWKTHKHSRMASWYALFFLFPAVLVPLISLRNEPQSPLANSWRSDISTATQNIRSMMTLNPSATRFLQVLERFSIGFFSNQTAQGGDEMPMEEPVDESPVTQMLSLRSLIFPDALIYGGENSQSLQVPQHSPIPLPDLC